MPEHDRERLLRQFGLGEAKDSSVESVPETKPVEEEENVSVLGDDEGYVAFKSFTRRRISLLVRPTAEPLQWLKYGYLLHVQADSAGTRVDLVFSVLIVTLTGRNLLPIAEAVANEACGKIQQFDARRWSRPADTSAAFIESIEYLMHQQGEAATENEAA